MTNKKVCDWCEKELNRGFVYTLETTITYFGGSNEVKPKPDDKVEICENCYSKHVKPIITSRSLIVYSKTWMIAEKLQKMNTELYDEFEKERAERWKLYMEREKTKITPEKEPEKDDHEPTIA